MPPDRDIRADAVSLAQGIWLKVDQARRMKDLERENARLKRLVADLALDKAILQEASKLTF